MSEIVEVRFLTDDKDARRRNELVIFQGKNGDWYVATVPEGEGVAGRGVRISTAGGAATAFPGLPTAIADAYRSIAKAQGLLEGELEETTDLSSKYIVIIWRDEDGAQLTPFGSKVNAEEFFDRVSMNWTESYLCKVLIGPRNIMLI